MSNILTKIKYSSFVFSQGNLLVRGVVDPEPILGKLGVIWEYTLTGMPVHLKAPKIDDYR